MGKYRGMGGLQELQDAAEKLVYTKKGHESPLDIHKENSKGFAYHRTVVLKDSWNYQSKVIYSEIDSIPIDKS